MTVPSRAGSVHARHGFRHSMPRAASSATPHSCVGPWRHWDEGGEPTGAATGFRSDVAAVAKRDLAAGEVLDGEGGYTVWGKQLPAARSLELGALPLGLAHGVTLRRARPAGEILRWADVILDTADPAVVLRRAMERSFSAPED